MITKILGLLILLAAAPVLAQTNHSPFCCRYPFRDLGQNQPVNLTPLFQWWIGNGGQNEELPAADGGGLEDPRRPLRAWKRITGIKTAEFDYGWVVNAEITTSPTSRTNEWIILKHPPAAEEARYYGLLALVAQDNEQMTNDLRANAADLKAAFRESARASRDDSSGSKSVRAVGDVYNQRAEAYRSAAAAAYADEKQYEQARNQALKSLADLPAARGRYVLDCFALELGRNSKGHLIFDVGAVDGYSQ